MNYYIIFFIFFILLFITFIYIILYFKNRLFDDVHKTLINVEKSQKTMNENQKQLMTMLENIFKKEKAIEDNIHKIK